MAYDGSLIFDTSMDGRGFQQGANKLMDIVKGLGVFALLEKGFDLVTASVDRAVSRYDTLNRFPKIMEQMGFSAQEAGTSMQKMSDGIQGLPTSLDQIVGSAQRIASMTGDLSGAADTTLALNNAFLASGASTEAAARGTEQYMQIIGRGKPEMEDWKTLQETMPYALQEVANSFGFAGTAATRDFYAALQSGEITVTQMNERFVELSTTTGGFADTAKTASSGIGTAFTNMQTAVVRGVTSVVEAIDSGLSGTRFQSIENIVSGAGKAIEKVLGGVAKAIEPVVRNLDVLTVAVGAAVAAFAIGKAGMAIHSFVGAIADASEACNIAQIALGGLIPITDKKTLADARAAAITALGAEATEQDILAKMAQGGVISRNTLLTGVFSGTVGIATVATNLWAAATELLNKIISKNPIVFWLSVISGAAAIIAGLIKWLSKGSKEFQAQEQAVEDLTQAQNDLTEAQKSGQSAMEDNLQSIEAESRAAQSLSEKINVLSQKENKSAQEKRNLATYVKELNAQQDGLNLAYNAEADALSLSKQKVDAYIAAKKKLPKPKSTLSGKRNCTKSKLKLKKTLS